MTAIFRWLICSLLLLVLMQSGLYAQIPGMRKYTQLDGFSATNGYMLYQDEKGYIWIGTDNGGVFFDGKNFRSVLGAYRIPDTDIIDCYPLGQNRVLLLPLTQKVCYFDNDTLVTFEKDSMLKNISSPVHNFSASDPLTGAYWLWGTEPPDKLYRFLGRRIQCFPVTFCNFRLSFVIKDRIIGMWENKDGSISPCSYDPVKKTYRYCHDKSGRKINWQEVFLKGGNAHFALTRSGMGKGRWVRVYEYVPDRNELSLVKEIKLPLGDSYIPRVQVDRFNKLWLSFIGKEGIYYYGDVTKNDKGYYFREAPASNTHFVDRNGNLWLSSPKNALYFISRNHFRNALLTDRFPLRTGIPKSIAGDGQGGICISYESSDKLAYIKDGDSRIIQLDDRFIEGSRSMLATKNNTFIFFARQVALYDVTTGKVNYLNKGSFAYSTTKDACFYGAQDLLVADNKGVNLITAYSRADRVHKVIFSNRSTSVEVLTGGAIIIGTPKGLYIKGGPDDSARQTGYPLLDESNITDIQQLPGNKALVGTNAYGLFLYSFAEGTVRRLRPEAIKAVRSIYRQDDSTYWVATSEGAIVLGFNKRWDIALCSRYTFYDGLPSNSVNSVYVYKDTAFIATSDGLGVLPLKDTALLAMRPPEICLNLLQAGHEKFRSTDTAVAIPPGQNDICFSLSAISYESLGNIRYYYRLYPIQQQWIATTEPEIRFARLPPGNYEFRAFARNAKGYRSKGTIVINIVVEPAFWQTVYFKLALTLFIITGLFLLSRWIILERHKKKIEKIQQKKRLAELELEAIKAQINPHFIHNCLNSIQYLNYRLQHELAQEYLGLFARMIRMTMKYSRQAFIPLSEEIDYLANYLKLEKLRFKEKLQYRFEGEKMPGKELLLPAMLIQPYVENALKHGAPPNGQTREIIIKLEEGQESLSVTISDNGPGFTAGGRSGTLGLRLSASRASSYNELFGLDISIRRYNKQSLDPKEQGAVVNIKIPKLKHGNII